MQYRGQRVVSVVYRILKFHSYRTLVQNGMYSIDTHSCPTYTRLTKDRDFGMVKTAHAG